MNYKHYDVAPSKCCNKITNQTTYESLLGVVCLLLTDDPGVFCKAYYLATHENSGMTTWSYLYPTDKARLRKLERQRQYSANWRAKVKYNEYQRNYYKENGRKI